MLKNRDWNAWNLTKRSRLYGSTTKKMIAGMIVKYARAPATFEVSPPDPAELGAPADGGGGPPAAATGDPQDPQNVAPSKRAAPHFAQFAMIESPP
jgi:hypothetical protein